jgi:hypothetical protein
LVPGDPIAWELAEDGNARSHCVQPLDLEYLRALLTTLSEWSSPVDEDAYGGL